MKESEIVPQIVSEVDAATPDNVDVRTTGGDQDVSLPEVIIDWTPSRATDGNGHDSFGDYITDENGNHVGIEHHSYWVMELDCVARTSGEAESDELLHQVQAAFLPYEHDATAFDPDTRKWDVGSTEPRENPVLEPDWYERGAVTTFEYLKRVEETGKDHITDINYNIDAE